MRELWRGFLALKSLVFAMLILILWARSYFVGDQFRKGDEAQWVQLTSAAGTAVVTFSHDGQATRGLFGSWDHVASDEPRAMLATAAFRDSPWSRIGFGYSRMMITSPVRGMIVNFGLPHWAMFLLAIPSAFRWGLRRRRVAMQAHHREEGMLECPQCGQLYARVPQRCAVCGQAMIITHAPGATT